MRINPVYTALVFALLSVGTLGCDSAPDPTSPSARAPETEGPLKVTCTIGMITDVAKAIGGEQVQVTGLMNSGVDPHLYKATQGDLEHLRNADLILYNGLHLEGRMADILVKMASRVPTYQVTDTIPEAMLREPPEFSGNYDPHVWFDVSLWKIVAGRIHEILSESAPAHKAYFDTQATAYLAELDALHEYATAQIASIPAHNRILVTAHDAFGYFGRAYGLEVLGIQGISTSSEYGLQDLNRLISVLVERKVPAVFVESSVSHRSIEALIAGVRDQGHEVVLGGELYSDAMGEAGTAAGTYLGMVRHNVDTIVEALGHGSDPG